MKPYDPANFVWFQLWNGEKLLRPNKVAQGLSIVEISQSLSELDLDAVQAHVSLYHHPDNKITIINQGEDAFEISRIAPPAEHHSRIVNKHIPLREIMIYVERYVNGDPGWFAGIDWEIDPRR